MPKFIERNNSRMMALFMLLLAKTKYLLCILTLK